MTPESIPPEAVADLAAKADPSEWKHGGDDEFYWCGPQSWGGCDMIEGRKENFPDDDSGESWKQFKHDCAFVAMSRHNWPLHALALMEAEKRVKELEGAATAVLDSFENYVSEHKPCEEWDEYDHAILPKWKRLREALSTEPSL